mgnify:CR=1 FL=1
MRRGQIFFAENKPRRINITLYGASNETYERLCHYPGGLDKAVNGIRLLRERNIDVKVNGSLAKANVDDRMKIIELGESLDAPVRIDTYMYPSVRERNHAYNNQARLDPEMAAKARVEVFAKRDGRRSICPIPQDPIRRSREYSGRRGSSGTDGVSRR